MTMKHRFLAAFAGTWLAASAASAFPYRIVPGDTGASLAEKMYGSPTWESTLRAVNHLAPDEPLTPGQRIELPSSETYRARPGDTWPDIAARILGDAKRAELLADANDTMPWLPPELGQDVIIPFGMHYLVQPGDSLVGVAFRFLGDRERALTIDRYNHLEGKALQPGQIVDIPLVGLTLTPAGRETEATALRGLCPTPNGARSPTSATALDARLADVRARYDHGDYLGTVASGEALDSNAALASNKRARLLEWLTNAYVALESPTHASEACSRWKRALSSWKADPVRMSPKVLRACENAAP